MKRDVRLYLDDILESIERIREYKKDITEEEFYRNTQIQDAVLRRVEIIGERLSNIFLSGCGIATPTSLGNRSQARAIS